MSLLEEVAGHIERVCNLADQARHALVQADESLDDAVSLLAGALTGSSDPEWEQVRANLGAASLGIRDLLANLDAAERAARAYLAELVHAAPESVPSAPVASPRPQTARHSPRCRPRHPTIRL